jgi:paraquat-inducible protein B
MKRFSATLIGSFVIGAIVLAAVAVIVFGGRGFGGGREYFVLFFDESVHGLERGSSVKLKGVRVGRVSSISVSYQSRTGGVVAQVVCELDRSGIVDEQGQSIDIRDPDVLRELVESGLQARLNLIGITGMLFVEMDFYGEGRRRQLQLEHPDYTVVPTIPSALSGVADHLAGIAQQLEAVDFAGIGRSVTQFMNTANTTLEEARIPEVVASLHEAVDSVNEVLRTAELRQTIEAAGRSFEDISRLAQRLEAHVDPLAESFTATTEDLRQTLEEISQTFAAVHDLIGPRLGLGPQASEALGSLNEAARSVQRLADFLERNPQAILRGRGETR